MPEAAGKVYITGLGAVTGFGRGLDALWQGLISGGQAPARAEAYEPPANMDVEARSHLGRASLFAADAAIQAVEDARLPFTAQTAPLIGVVMGSEHGERERPVPGAPATSVARILGVAGPLLSLTGPASGLAAVVQGFEMVSRGIAPVVIAGGIDVLPPEAGLAVSPGVPFASGRAGPRLTEGACAVVLEHAEVAEGRQARVLAELLGGGLTFSRATVMRPGPNFVDQARAMRAALLRGELFQGEVEALFASAAGDPDADLIELRSLGDLWGPNVDRLTVTSSVGATGQAGASAGALSLAGAVRSLVEGIVPPVAGLSEVDGAFDRLDIVTGEPRQWRYKTAMVNAFSEAANASVVVRSAQ